VREAGNGDDALQFLEADTGIGLLFTDVTMPGSMSGSDLACQVFERWPRVGIILTSGRPRPDGMPSRMRFHAKPYEPTVVLRQASEMTNSLGRPLVDL
jgi:CheY-like chemotaxis protein